MPDFDETITAGSEQIAGAALVTASEWCKQGHVIDAVTVLRVPLVVA